MGKKKDGRQNNGGARDGSGRKSLEVTDRDRKQVETLSGWGIPHEQIGTLVCGGICRDTLYKYFHVELVKGKAIANATVGKAFYEKVMKAEDTTAMIWWTKSQMGWKDHSKIELSGDSENPVSLNMQVTFVKSGK